MTSAMESPCSSIIDKISSVLRSSSPYKSKKREYKISSATATGDENVTSKYNLTSHLIISSCLPSTIWVKHPVTELVRKHLKKRERMKINRCMPALSS